MPTRPRTHRPAGSPRGHGANPPGSASVRPHAAYDATRPSAARRGYGRRWQRYRLAYLAEHPLCVVCEAEGRYEPATDVDHVVPVTGPDDPTFWDTAGHAALCHRHHSEKTARESGFGKVTGVK